MAEDQIDESASDLDLTESITSIVKKDFDDELTFQIIVGGSLRGKCLLKDSRGYTYTLKVEKGEKSWWRCSKRTATFRCGASVSQVGDVFTVGKFPHEHPPDPEKELTPQTKKRRELKRQMQEEMSSQEMYVEFGSGDNGSSPVKMPFNKSTPAKKGTANSEMDIQQTLIKIERERLQIDQQRLKVERERLEVTKLILDEVRNHNSNCVHPAITQMSM